MKAKRPELFTRFAHPLQAGFLISAAAAAADVLSMMEVYRHKRTETLQGYVRKANAFNQQAGAGFP